MDTKYTGTKIASVRKEKGLTQNDIAEALHVSVSAVSKWERGLNYPDLSLMEPLASLLGIGVSELLGLEGESTDRVIKNITEISEEERSKSKRSLRTKLGILCGAVVLFLILSWSALMLVSRDEAMYLLFRFDRTGFLTLINLLLGIAAWVLAAVGIFSRKGTDRWKSYSVLSFFFSSLALYIPTLYCDLIMRFENYGTVEDTIGGYNFASLVLILGTVIFNLCSYIVNREK